MLVVFWKFRSCNCKIVKVVYSYFLEVNKAWLVCVKHEAAAVGTHRVLADSRLCVFELLLHIFDDRLTVQTEKGAADQLWMHGVGSHHLTTDA